MPCLNHPDRISRGACDACGHNFCSDCLVPFGGKQYCRSDYVEVLGGKKPFRVVQRASDAGTVHIDKTENKVESLFRSLRNLLLGICLCGAMGAIVLPLLIGSRPLPGVLMAAGILAGLAGLFLLGSLGLEGLSSFFYMRNVLKTKVSYAEAFYLRRLFTINNRGGWYACTSVLGLDPEKRKDILFSIERLVREEMKREGKKDFRFFATY